MGDRIGRGEVFNVTERTADNTSVYWMEKVLAGIAQLRDEEDT